MASILDLVQQHLGPQEIAQIGQQLGTDPAATKQAIDAALPALVGGMASTAQSPQGAGELTSLMGLHGGVLGNLGSAITAGGSASGGILGSILGHHQPAVESGVQQASGMSSDRTRKLLMILAPIVLSALARRAGIAGGTSAPAGAGGGGGLGGALGGVLSGGLGNVLNGGLGDILRQDATQAHQQAQDGPMGGVLGKILGGLGG